MKITAPLRLHSSVVEPGWIDYNQHMNLAYYVLAFDKATDAFFDFVGLDERYRKTTGFSTFLLETHVRYLHEMKLGDPLRFELQLLDYDQRRLHYFQTMYHADKGFPAATTELLFINVDTRGGRSVPMPDSILRNLESIMNCHRQLPIPDDMGRVMGISRKKTEPSTS